MQNCKTLLKETKENLKKKERHSMFMGWMTMFFIFYLFIYWLCWVFDIVQGLSLVVVCGLLTAVASRLEAWALELTSFSICGVYGLSGPTACEIFQRQKSNLCPLHWQADS